MKVLYEDNHLIVAVKPPMVPSQADSSGDPDMLSIVKEYVREKYGKPGNVYIGLVHRLDRPTSGIMVFARTSKAAARLAKQVQDGSLEKRYRATVLDSSGSLPEQGVFVDMLYKDRAANTVFVRDCPGAKRAELSYKVIDRRPGEADVEVRLVTGRSHQIRVQFSSRGWTLLGDARYGKKNAPRRPLALCACYLAFFHPTTRERLTFSIEPPRL